MGPNQVASGETGEVEWMLRVYHAFVLVIILTRVESVVEYRTQGDKKLGNTNDDGKFEGKLERQRRQTRP